MKEIPNKIGSAPGICLENDGFTLCALPGVPLRLAAMLPWVIENLEEKFPPTQFFTHEWIYLIRVSETKVDPLLQELIKRYPDLQYGIYPSQGILSVHLIAPKGAFFLNDAVKK